MHKALFLAVVLLIALHAHAQLFGPRVILSTNFSWPRNLGVRDIDDDGLPEVFVESQLDGRISLFKNQGDFNFGFTLLMSLFPSGFYDVHIEDLDGDGSWELWSGGFLGTVYHSQVAPGVWSWPASNRTVVDSTLASWLLFDFIDSDSVRDVVMSSWPGNIAIWFRGLGSNSFSAPITIINVPNANQARVADFDDDFDNDLVLVSAGDSSVRVFFNADGTGTWDAPLVLSTSSNGVFGCVTADFDVDGHEDIVTASGQKSDSKVEFFRNLGGRVFASSLGICFAPCNGALRVLAHDGMERFRDAKLTHQAYARATLS